ncbi:hypothetical protein Pfo_016350 [Paulownia fortunei]|nr:hypothetical protein Pfo_016350 [Paulownia fortunei]
MGKKEKQQQQPTKENSNRRGKEQQELPMTLEDFNSKESWDQFFILRGCDYFSEWYAEWPQLQSLLTTHLLFPSSAPPESAGAPPPTLQSEEVSILVPGCGNSRLSEHLYDAGFRNIINVDFSKVVISHMLRRNVRERSRMKWRVMDMTSMQFANETFDAIVDKGGLDVLMEPELGLRSGNLYLSEVKRLLKAGGKYICLTLAESNVLGLLFPKFRFGWKVNVYAIAQEPSAGILYQQAFLVVAEKHLSTVVSQISSFLDEYSVESHGNQAHELYEALEREKGIRTEYSNGSDICYPLEDLNLGVKGNLTELEPGRRVKLILGEPGVSRFFYDCILFDAQRDSGPFSAQFRLFLVPKTRTLEWMLSSGGQWVIVKSLKAARLLMIVLDSRHSNVAMEDIQRDLYSLVKQLALGDSDDGAQIPFVVASDGIKQRKILHQVTSALAGPIVVDDVIYEKIDAAVNRHFPSKHLLIRRVTFEGMVQSEALLSRGPKEISSEVEKNKVQAASKTRKKGKQRKFDSQSSGSHASSGEMKVYHNYLASAYHNGIISGLMLISLHLKGSTSAWGLVKTVVIGLGAGLLPMFMKNCLPSLKIEIAELDPVVLDVAREYFGFREDERVKVHITDGIKFVREKADSKAVHAEGKGYSKVDILIVDADSPNSSYGLSSPAAGFVEESFLLNIKNSLSEEGLFVFNLVSRSSAVKGAVYSRLKMVFSNLFSLQLEEDVSEVIFALKTDSPIKEDQLSEACNVLARTLELEKQLWSQRVIDASKLIKPLR